MTACTNGTPLISIITPTLNRASFLHEAIESVQSQAHPFVEHIIVDGGSTDGSLDVLASYPHLRWISEADDGLYAALNKGLEMSRGSIVGHLNSDDLLAPGILKEVAEAFDEDADLDVVHGHAELLACDTSGSWKVVHHYADEGLSLASATTGIPIVNAKFFRRRVYSMIGDYDARYRLAGDRDFLIRACLFGLQGRALDRIAYQYRTHSDSLTIGGEMSQARAMGDENLAIALRYLDEAQDDESAETLRSWIRHTVSDMVWFGLARRRPELIAHFARFGWKVDRRWPATFFCHAARQILRKLIRKPR